MNRTYYILAATALLIGSSGLLGADGLLDLESAPRTEIVVGQVSNLPRQDEIPSLDTTPSSKRHFSRLA